MRHNLANTERDWSVMAANDPMWAILTEQDKRGNRWDATEFFATGQRDVERMLARADALHLMPMRRDRALDFGCGLGRLTQALADTFARVDGVDIAAPMITQAQRLHARDPRLVFHYNPASNLSIFPDASFDLVFTYITLQHNRREAVASYLSEFIRVLRTDGLALLHIPSRLRVDRQVWERAKLAIPRLYRWYRRRRFGSDATMETHTIPVPVVRAAVERAGGTVRHVDEPRPIGAMPNECWYYAHRR